MARNNDNLQQLKLIEFCPIEGDEISSPVYDYSLYQKTAAALVHSLKISPSMGLGLFIGTGRENTSQQAIVSWLLEYWPSLNSRNVKRQFDQIKRDLADTLTNTFE